MHNNRPVKTQQEADQYHVVMFLGEQQDSSYIGFVVVERVQLRWGHVERSILGETVVQSIIQGQQIHVMHRQIVGVVTTLQVAHVDQRRSVKSETMTRRETLRFL